MSDNKYMNRSLDQAVYKYLPGAWADYYDPKNKAPYSTIVNYWNTVPMKSFDKVRLFREINYRITSFQAHGGILEKKFNNITIDTLNVKSARLNNNEEDIRMEISPLVFFCDKCFATHRFRNFRDIKMKCQKPECNGFLKQISLSFSCDCGWTAPVEVIPCSEHGFESIKYLNGKFKFLCSKCNKKIEILKKCPVCKSNNKNYPKASQSSEHFFAKTINYIEIMDDPKKEFFFKVNSEKEKVIKDSLEPSDVVIGYWLKSINNEELDKVIESKQLNFNENFEENEEIKIEIEKFATEYSVSLEKAREFVLSKYKKKGNIFEILNRVNKNKIHRDLDQINSKEHTTIEILEYLSLINSEYKFELTRIIEENLMNDPAKDKYKLEKMCEEHGLSDLIFVKNVPILNFAYGYTRKSPSPVKDGRVTIKSFNEDKNGIDVYGRKIKTEGILFTFDRYKIMKWLDKNEVLGSLNVLDDELFLKKWFVDNIIADEIFYFDEISKDLENTKWVYTMLHTISHGLIKALGELSGLDMNSLSEHIMPSVPAIFIYCNNEQGITLGALETLVNTDINRVLKQVKREMRSCIFDPICMNDTGSCIGCTIVDPVSCKHSNKDLDRRYICGGIIEKNRIIGYWE